jgi:predicted AlkP superfamily pyrophosphatase or phosphodiesterase
MAPDLEELFAAGVLLRPSDSEANLVHLVRAVAMLAGVRDLPVDGPARELIDLIGPAEHIVFVVIDGLGMNIVRRLPPACFLCSGLTRELRATCPSTTACALTTISTGMYPNRHGAVGWFTHVPELETTVTLLPFQERHTHRPLAARGLTPGDLLPPPLCPRMSHRPLSIVPLALSDTPYNKYARGGTAGAGYGSITQAIDMIIERLRSIREPSYTHLYLPEVDSICHKLGVYHPSVVPLVEDIDEELQRLAEALNGRAKIIVTADHGLIDVPRMDQALLQDGDTLLELLAVPPSGDARMPIFHLRDRDEATREDFAAVFFDRFGEQMVLLEPREAERLELFGPGAIEPRVRPRLGDFIAIPYRPATVAYLPPEKSAGDVFCAVHAGLSPEEMQTPLCVV